MSTIGQTNPYKGIPYAGGIDIRYAKTKEGIVPELIIETDRLSMQPVSEQDIPFYSDRLYGNKETMSKYADTIPRDMEYVSKRVNGWISRFMKDDLFFCILR